VVDGHACGLGNVELRCTGGAERLHSLV
jgi:hypothetical protein